MMDTKRKTAEQRFEDAADALERAIDSGDEALIQDAHDAVLAAEFELTHEEV